METIALSKGAADIVTSVPLDRPDDLITILNLAKAWAELGIHPIITTPNYGDLYVLILVRALKSTSPKDVRRLKKAKEIAYEEGYYQGTLNVGEFRGETVDVTKAKIRQQLIETGLAFPYSEPERNDISRPGDDCIVAPMNQWYLDYDEESWKKAALGWVGNADGKV
ncbi:hypothetical protein F5B21DRAFT_510277 [Xylaria acuta]|nr:hypothetical protein F5B21DRAFT_510277 [Xylaria acuta]